MIIIPARTIETSEGPAEITAQNVQYWCQHTKQLLNSQSTKAKKFLENGSIVYFGDGKFACNPIIGYNTRTYNMERRKGIWTCDCQGWVLREHKGELGEDGVSCSHLLALMYAFKIKYFKQWNGRGELNGECRFEQVAERSEQSGGETTEATR